MSTVEPDRKTTVLCGQCKQEITVLNGAWARYRRERKGVSLREVARRMELSAAYLSDLERNERRLSGEMLGRFLKAVEGK